MSGKFGTETVLSLPVKLGLVVFLFFLCLFVVVVVIFLLVLFLMKITGGGGGGGEEGRTKNKTKPSLFPKSAMVKIKSGETMQPQSRAAAQPAT